MQADPGTITMARTDFDDEAEKPLDPAAERVRRRLVRFVAINLGLLFAAVMIVLAAIVYKAATSETEPAGTAAPLPADDLHEAEIALPAGARIRSHALSDAMLSLRVALEDGEEAVFVYDIADGRLAARIDIAREAP